MKRPNIKDYFKDSTTINDVHKSYISSPELFKYASAADRYIDYLEEQMDCNIVI